MTELIEAEMRAARAALKKAHAWEMSTYSLHKKATAEVTICEKIVKDLKTKMREAK